MRRKKYKDPQKEKSTNIIKGKINDKNYNPFSPLTTYFVKCDKCSNPRSIAVKCPISSIEIKEEQTEVCGIYLYAKYRNNCCFKHMAGDQGKFLTLKKEKGGNLTLGGGGTARIKGKGTMKLDKRNVNAKNVLFVELLKYNLLHVGKMCDQGYILTFFDQECEIRKNNSKEIIAKGVRTHGNVYVLE